MLGKYLEDALTRAGMSQSELARRWRKESSTPIIGRVMRGERTVSRETLIEWCRILDCPYELEERILNVAGYSTDRQIAAYSNAQEVEAFHQRVLRGDI